MRGPRSEPASRVRTLALFLILLLAAAVRCYEPAREGLWLDEAMSVRFARMPLADILTMPPASEYNPPLYYALLHAWVGMWGEGETAVRSLSIVLGVAAVWLLYASGGCCWAGRAAVAASFAAPLPRLLLAGSPELRAARGLTSPASTRSGAVMRGGGAPRGPRTWSRRLLFCPAPCSSSRCQCSTSSPRRAEGAHGRPASGDGCSSRLLAILAGAWAAAFLAASPITLRRPSAARSAPRGAWARWPSTPGPQSG